MRCATLVIYFIDFLLHKTDLWNILALSTDFFFNKYLISKQSFTKMEYKNAKIYKSVKYIKCTAITN